MDTQREIQLKTLDVLDSDLKTLVNKLSSIVMTSVSNLLLSKQTSASNIFFT